MTGDLAVRVSGSRTTWTGTSLFGETMLILPADPAAFFEGFCPNCRVPLAGSVLNWCPQCKTYWNTAARTS